MRITLRNAIEGAQIVAWRRAQLIGAGVPAPLAAQLANDARYDVHALIELTERGCAPELAMRILAPLDELGDAA